MRSPRRFVMVWVIVVLMVGTIVATDAHRSGCHRWHACPSDRGTCVWGDLGYGSQCPDNQYCQGGNARTVVQTPAPPPQPEIPTTAHVRAGVAAGNTTIQSFSQAKKLMRQVFAGHERTFYCAYDGATVDIQSCGYQPKKHSKRARQLEWEHVVPAEAFGQSFPAWRDGHPECDDRKGKAFQGRNCARKMAVPFRYMEADLYNLQPSIGGVNQLRPNYSMAMIDGETRDFGRCDLEIEDRKIEPRPDIRGTLPGPTFTWTRPTRAAASSPRKTENSLRRGTERTRWMHGSPSGCAALSGCRATRIRLCSRP
jgi:endonuclease I